MTAPLTTSPTVQAVMDAITAGLASMPNVAVLDPTSIQQVYESKSVTVGGSWDPDTGTMSSTDAIVTDVTEAGAGRRTIETTRISCVAFSGDGDTVLTTDRDSVNAILTAVRDAVRSLAAVGASSARAEMTAQQWAQIVDEQGSGVVAIFEVTVMVLP
ncbi:MAG: hypothetical protein JWO98_4731 [Frankiales bacterium]|nr:hypothetical protein [Frankiales bacterium]